MKALGARRLYHCFACDAVLFVSPDALKNKRQVEAARRTSAGAVKLKIS